MSTTPFSSPLLLSSLVPTRPRLLVRCPIGFGFSSSGPTLKLGSISVKSDRKKIIQTRKLAHGSDDRSSIDQESQERDYAGTPYVPVYVMLPLGIINENCMLVNQDGLIEQLKTLKSINVDGVMVDCWWGIVEARTPKRYNWEGYSSLFRIVRDVGLKLQVVMSFHACGGNVGDNANIPLPEWVRDIGQSYPDIYYMDREARRNTESLTWGIDERPILLGRTALQVYYDFMCRFRAKFSEFFECGTISEIGVGLGPCGELRYPSYPAVHGWMYPGIGEFQCYDKYLFESLKLAAEAKGHASWAMCPDNTGSYNSTPNETEFFHEGGVYDTCYGRFFLNWYSRGLIVHGDRVLALANEALQGVPIAAKVSGIHWWYKTASHAAELTAGFYNHYKHNGYAPIARILKKNGATLNFTCVELRTVDQTREHPEALSDPEALVSQVLNIGWDARIPVAGENALDCYNRNKYNTILKNAKPDDRRHLSTFTYLRLSPCLMEHHNLNEFARFVKRMHGAC